MDDPMDKETRGQRGLASVNGITDGLGNGEKPLHGGGGPLSVHDEPRKFAAAVAALLTDEALWRRRSEAALRFARTELSEDVLDTRMAMLLRTLATRRCAAGGEQAQRACRYSAARDDE